EGVAVPLERAEPVTGRGKERVGAACRRRADLAPAELGCGAEEVGGPEAAGEDLRSEADAEDGAPGLRPGPHRPGEGREVGMRGVVDGRLFAAQHDERVPGGEVAGQAAVDAGTVHDDFRAGL